MNSIDERLAKLRTKSEKRIAKRLAAKLKDKRRNPSNPNYLTSTEVREARAKFGINAQCMICMKKPQLYKAHAIDHCHVTGKVRGILCHKCNTGLGYFNEDVELLKSAISYLNEHILDPNFLSDEELERLRLIQNR